MVGQGDPHPSPPNKMEEEIVQEAEVKLARATRLAREADKVAGKRHRGRQDDSGTSEDEGENGVTYKGHHPKFNRQCLASRDCDTSCL
jgi:hypothetical protein